MLLRENSSMEEKPLTLYATIFSYVDEEPFNIKKNGFAIYTMLSDNSILLDEFEIYEKTVETVNGMEKLRLESKHKERTIYKGDSVEQKIKAIYKDKNLIKASRVDGQTQIDIIVRHLELYALKVHDAHVDYSSISISSP